MPNLRLALLLLCCGSPAVLAQRQALQLQLPADTTLHYTAVTQMVMNMALPRQLDTQLRIELSFDLHLGKAAADGKTAVTATVRRLQIQVDNPPLSKIDYDSERPHDDAGMLHELTALVGKAFGMRLDARGHLDGMQLPKDFPAAAAQLFGGDMGQFFADYFPELPEQPVTAGDSWQTATTMPLQQSGSTTIAVENRLVSVQQQRASVAQTLQVDTSKLDLPPGVTLEVALVEASYEFDLRDGSITVFSTTMDVNTKGKQNGMPVDMRQHLVRTLRLQPQTATAPPRPGEAK